MIRKSKDRQDGKRKVVGNEPFARPLLPVRLAPAVSM